VIETQKQLSEQGQNELTSLLSFLVNGKDRLKKIYTFWCIKGPSLEANAGLTAMILEEAGHVSIIKGILKRFDLPISTTNFRYLDEPPKNWVDLVVTVNIYDRFFYEVFGSIVSTGNKELSNNFKKVLIEEKFHADFGREWTNLLASSDNFHKQVLVSIGESLNSLQVIVEQLSSESLVKESILKKDLIEEFELFKEKIYIEVQGKENAL
jgi:1,2-phenylacetyl-CoA epoxidase catalytic subunit